MAMNAVVRDFHKVYYGSEVWFNTSWFGTPTQKCPLDLWVYQEIIHETRPDLIVECGTNNGGSTAFLGALLDLTGKGRILSIDIREVPDRPSHPRIEYLTGSSVDSRIVAEAERAAATSSSTLIILDSDHSYRHVIEELRCYHRLVTPNNYLIVEDTNVNGNPVLPDFGPGPAEAVREFLRENQQFVVDLRWEKFMLTFNPGGYLRRVNDRVS
jgi:cephalosporin hydroxylase